MQRQQNLYKLPKAREGIPPEEFQATYFRPNFWPTFTPISALATWDFRLRCAILTWLNPSSLPQSSLMRLSLSFIEQLLAIRHIDCQAIPKRGPEPNPGGIPSEEENFSLRIFGRF
jgi:hypothetical protein